MGEARHSTGDVLRLARRSVLVLWRPPAGTQADVASLVEACRRWYAPLLGTVHASSRAYPDGTVLLCLSDEALPATLPDVVLWGMAVGTGGELGDDDLRGLVEDPVRARPALGVFVVAGPAGRGVRLVTSADLAAPLRRVTGPSGAAVATKGVPALLAAGRTVEIATEHVVEHVFFSYVHGDDELLRHVEQLPEASVVQSGQETLEARSYWPVADRFTPEGVTTAASLRRSIGQHLQPVGRLRDPWLGLSAGRDSVLVAGCMAEHGLTASALTIGNPDSPDNAGAEEVARRLGWPHVHVGNDPDSDPAPRFERAVLASRWTEGAQTARDIVGPPLRWPPGGAARRLLVFGVAGELGRGGYWRNHPIDADPLEVVTRGLTGYLDPGRAAALVARVDASLRGVGDGVPQRGIEVLDVLMARTYARKWLSRHVPLEGFHATVSAYTHPDIVRTLLSIPTEQRKSGEVFEEALLTDPQRVAEGARTAATAASGSAAGPGLGRRVQRRLRPRPPDPRLEPTLAQVGADGIGRAVMGDAWWRRVRREWWQGEPHERWVWHLLAAEALAVAVRDAPRP